MGDHITCEGNSVPIDSERFFSLRFFWSTNFSINRVKLLIPLNADVSPRPSTVSVASYIVHCDFKVTTVIFSGLETPEYEGIAIDAMKNSGLVNTSMIWPPKENATQVSWWTISDDIVSSKSSTESQLTTYSLLYAELYIFSALATVSAFAY